MRMTLEDGMERRGYRVWKAWIGKRVLDSKCVSTLGSGVWRVGRKEEPRPALRTKTSIWVMEYAARVARRVLALSLWMERDSVKGTMTRRLPSAKGRARRSAVEVVEERMVATTVVFGRWRRVLVSSRPIPVHNKE
jgi:hypothetical protein